MTKKAPEDRKNFSFNNFPEEVKSRLIEKRAYEEKLTLLLEQVRQAALGIDYQTKVHLKMVEKRILDKIIQTEADIKNIISSTKSKLNELQKQGQLFDE